MIPHWVTPEAGPLTDADVPVYTRTDLDRAIAAAVEAERARIRSGAESLKHATQGKAIDVVDWDELADLVEGRQP